MKHTFKQAILYGIVTLMLYLAGYTPLFAQLYTPGPVREVDPNDPNPKVKLFDGTYFANHLGDVAPDGKIVEIPNRALSSIVIPMGMKATLYNPVPPMPQITLYPGNYPVLGELWHNTAGRIKVDKMEPNEPVAYLIDDYNDGDYFMGLGVGEYDYLKFQLFGNDIFVNVRVYGPINVYVYDGAGFTGNYEGPFYDNYLTDGGYASWWLSNALINRVSSVKILPRGGKFATIDRFIWRNTGSDYYAPVEYSVSPESWEYCDKCGLSGTLTIEAGDFSETRNPPNTSGSSGTFQVALGPGQTDVEAVLSYHSGSVYALHADCSNPNVHFPCGYATAIPKTIKVSTVPFKAPTLQAPVLLTGGSAGIELTWTKNSDVPDELITTRIYRNNQPYKTIDPGIRTFTDKTFGSNPGPYTYKIQIQIEESGITASSNEVTAYAPIGIIEGNVATRPGGASGTVTPVRDVEVCAILQTSLPELAAGASFCASTDDEGNYRIENIYFGEEATFRIVPSKPGHGFDPDFRERTLKPQITRETNVDFTDTTSFQFSGRIVQLDGADSCGVGQAELLINGKFLGDYTDPDGYFSLVIPQAGDYTITPRLGEHTFTPAQLALEIDGNVEGQVIEDLTRRTLSGFVRAGCEEYIGQAEVRISSPDGCLDTTFVTTAETGAYDIELPARPYRVEVLGIDLPAGSGLDEGEVVGFFDTKEIDLTDRDSLLNFTYRKSPVIEITGLEEAPCAAVGFPILEQYELYTFEILVWEEVGVCPVDTGTLRIVDNISEPYIEREIPIKDGRALYTLEAGVPNIVAPYSKNVSFTALVDGREEQQQVDVIVTGVRAREKTFATVTPELPFMILRDPPGDASSSFLERNATLETALSFSTLTDNSVNPWVEAKVGTKFEVGFGYTTEFSVWGKIGASFTYGASTNKNREFITTLTSGERFSTSGNQYITGAQGDVFVGAAMNIIYALADEVRFNPAECSIETDVSLIMGNDGFATTYVYTEDHIRNVLIPQLNQLTALNQVSNPDTAAYFRDQVSIWEQTLQRNEELKDKANFVENRSFSANAPYDAFTTASSTERISIEFSELIETEVAFELGLEVAGIGVSGGARVKMRMETGKSRTQTTTKQTTTGYHLSDDDPGDFFSVDIKTDPVYNTPVFDIVSGRSSCPLEPHTQPRDDLRLQAENLVETNVDPDGQAVFKLKMINTSQSEEKRKYQLFFNQASNPEGARVRIGGSEIQGPIPFFIPFGQQVEATVTVERGPSAFSYPDLEFILSSTCDTAIHSSVKLSAYFQSDCSAISLQTPEPEWVVSTQDAGLQTVRLTDYEKDKLDRVTIEYAAFGTNSWETLRILQPVDLSSQPGGTNVSLDLSALPDGRYQLRARLGCDQGFVFSQSVAGLIDRAPPRVFGIPEPADGEYIPGKELSVTFDEPVNCLLITSANVQLVRASDEAVIPASVGCSGNKLIFLPDENLFAQVGETYNVQLSDVEDLYGNRIDEPLEWSFTIGSGGGVNNPDLDADGIPNDQDNCLLANNPNQRDSDGDGIGDACDDDIDGDGVDNQVDNAPYHANPDQTDTDMNGIGDVAEPDADGDQDGIPNAMDNCPTTSNADQSDLDADGIGDGCDDDMDGDGIPNHLDNCVTIANAFQEDEDGNGIGNQCEGLTGVEEVSLFDYFHLYPNPVSDVLNIELQPAQPGRFSIGLYDSTGKRLRMQELELSPQGATMQLYVDQLPAGLYYLLLSNGKRSFGKRVVVP